MADYLAGNPTVDMPSLSLTDSLKLDPVSGGIGGMDAGARNIAKIGKAKEQDPELRTSQKREMETGEKWRKKETDAFDAVTPFKPAAAPKEDDYRSNPIAAWGSLMGVFGMLVSGRGGKLSTKALNAAAASIEAQKKGDFDAYSHAYTTWKDTTKDLLDQHKMETEDWKNVHSLAEHDMAAAHAQATMLSHKYDDVVAQQQLQMGMLGDVLKLKNDSARVGAELSRVQIEAEREGDQHKLALEERQNRQDLRAAFATEDPDKIDVAKENLLATRGLALAKRMIGESTMDPETLKFAAEQYLAGDKSAVQNVGRGAQGAANIIALKKAIAETAREKGMSGGDLAQKMAEFEGLKSSERTLGTRSANIEMAVTEAEKLMPLALEASKRVDRSQFPSLNDVIIAGQKGVGGEDVVRLGIATNSLINVYARAINPTGTPTVSDKEHARELLSSAWSNGQYAAGVDQLNLEMKAAEMSPGEVKKNLRTIGGDKKEEAKRLSGPPPGSIRHTDAKGENAWELNGVFYDKHGSILKRE